MQLTQKEVSLLKDMRNQEKLCIDKYSKYAAEAKSMCRLCTTPACLSSRRMICARCSIGFRPTSSTMVSNSGSI